jgi:hypothetical protein
LKGTLEAVACCSHGSARPISGTVYLRPTRGTAVSVAVGPDGAFSAEVAVGSYTVTGNSPHYVVDGVDAPCGSSPPGTVSVAANQTESITVECLEIGYGGTVQVTFAPTATAAERAAVMTMCGSLPGVTASTINPDGTGSITGPPAGEGGVDEATVALHQAQRQRINACLTGSPFVARAVEPL